MGVVLCFGELLLRLSPPGRELLLQTPRLDVWVGGAEANVATALACLGHSVRFASAVPDSDLGRAAVATLRGHGVDVSGVVTGPGRMGLYFATAGAGVRRGEVLYDRAGSAFAEAAAWDWDRLLEGMDRLHLSGITPALGPGPAAHALAAVEAANARGVAVSFDGNWRGALWARWDADPRALLTPLVAGADLLFGDHRDIGLLLGCDIAAEDAAGEAFAAFPRLRTIASTTRRIDGADRHRLSARVATREGAAETGELLLAGIIDRIGAGDAFAAGVLDALAEGGDARAMAERGLALAALKHSLPGDASLFRRDQLDGFAAGLDVRR